MGLSRPSGGNNSGKGSQDRSAARGFAVSRDPLRIALALLIFFTIGRAHQHYAFIGAVRPALLLFGLAVAYALLKPSALSTARLFDSWPPKVLAALGVMACLSIPFGISIGNSGKFVLESYSKVLITTFVTIAAIRHVQDLRTFVWAYVAGCAFVVWLSVGVFQLASTGTMYRLNDLYMFDANGMGVILVSGLPLAVLLYQNSSRWPRWISLAVMAGIGVSLARSGSRGGFLGLLVVGALLLLFLRRISAQKRIAFVGIVALGLAFAAPPGYWTQIEGLTEPTDDYNWTSPYGRKAIAERGLGYLSEHPVFGVGIGNFSKAEATLSEIAESRRATGSGFRLTAAHNSYVQVGAEMGIPGLLIWCALVFGGVVGPIRLRGRLPARWRDADPARRFVYDLALFLPISFAGFAVTATFVSFAYHDVIYVLAALVAGTYACARRLLSEDLRTEHSRSPVAQRRVPGRRSMGAVR